MIVTVNITKDHVRYGKRGDPCECAVAMAIEQATGCPCTVSPRRCALYMPSGMPYVPAKEVKFLLPEEIIDWIRNFDIGNTVYPTTFSLELPDEYSHPESEERAGTA